MDHEPLYIRIQHYYKDAITSGRLQKGDKIPTEKELLEQFGVSRITIANALGALARKGWIQRIPGRGTFVRGIPESDAEYDQPRTIGLERGGAPGNAASGARPRIGLIIPFLQDYFAIRLLNGISDAVERAGYSLHVMLSFNDKEREKELIREFRELVQGLIIFPVDAEIYNEEIIALKMNGFPFVLLDRYMPGVETNAVYADGALAAKLAVEHLWALGHRSIAICADTPLSTVSVDERVNGYMNALKERGALINPALLLTDFAVQSAALDGEHPLVRAIHTRAATAYIALNSKLGLHIAALANTAGLEVPRDLSIVTFDNPGRGDLDEQRAFTYIHQNESELGRQAVEVLLNVLDGESGNGSVYSRIVLEPELVVRETTAAAPSVREVEASARD